MMITIIWVILLVIYNNNISNNGLIITTTRRGSRTIIRLCLAVKLVKTGLLLGGTTCLTLHV